MLTRVRNPLGPPPIAAHLIRSGADVITTLHLVCGLPCSGKTSLAKQLERDLNAVRLTPDEWAMALLGDLLPAKGLPLSELVKIRDPVEDLLWNHAARLLQLGVDVILDNGFWTRADREDYRARGAAAGARTELHFLDVPSDVLLARLEARNHELPPGVFWIDPAWMEDWIRLFEPPAEDELVPRDAP